MPPKPEAAAPEPKKEETVVKPIETYQGDIEKLVQKKNVSVVSIAAAEAQRRESAEIPQEAPRNIRPLIIKSLMILGGVILLLAAAAAIYYVVKPAPAVQVSVVNTTPFINVDQTLAFIVPAGIKRGTAMNAIEVQREKVKLSLGLVARIYLGLSIDPATKKLTPLSAQQLLTILGPNASDSLLRAVGNKPYLLGVHSYEDNQPFLILQTDAYEQAFSGMLAWEPYMYQDLAPLFVRIPPQHILEGKTATSSATSTPTFIQTGFIDRIVENHDTRVIENSAKDILLLWGFINRNTLVITTNEATMREVISRLKNAPIVPTP